MFCLTLCHTRLISPLLHVTDKSYRAALIGADSDGANSVPSPDPLQALKPTRRLLDESYRPLRGSTGSDSGTHTRIKESVIKGLACVYRRFS